MTDSRSLLMQAVALSLGPAAGLGLARFGYALLLPAMRSELAWTYAEAGSMNTANAFGYLAGALVAAPLARRFGTRRAFVASFLVTALSLVGSGLTANFLALLSLRAVAGFAAASLFVDGATLAAHLASGAGSDEDSGGGRVLGLYFGGVGIGVLVTGLGLPLLLEAHPEAWPLVWIGMGALSLLALWPAGRAAWAAHEPPGEAASAHERAEGGNATRPQQPLIGGFLRMDMLPALVAYFLYGLGYITYMTFVIDFLAAAGAGPWSASAFWMVLGTSTFASAFVWGGLVERTRGGWALAILLLVLTAGAALPLASTSLAGVLVSGVLFGGSFLSVVSAVTALTRRGLPPAVWGQGIALFTIVFSAGQTLGPVLAGALADATGTLASGFALSAALLLVSAAVAAFQPALRPAAS